MFAAINENNNSNLEAKDLFNNISKNHLIHI